MGATTDMHQTCDAHIHQKDGAPVESIPFALKNMFLSVYPSFRGLGRWSIEMGLPPPEPGPPP